MLRKFIIGFILVPLAILFVAFAVANRHSVIVTLDPFNQAQPALAVAIPLFALLLGVTIAGVVLGGAAAWIRQAKWRRAARLAQAQSRVLAAELDQLKQRAGEGVRQAQHTVPFKYEPRLTIPPPAA
jgi:uncharacterized integral membrane protein